MSVAGAYAPEATYSHADISSIVDYAHARGIRLVPEFDMPAHATVWGAGYPNFTISCADGQTLLNPVPEAGLYEAVDGLLGEFLPLFHSADFVHFGGDEVEDLTCWNESAAVQAFMASQGLPDVNAVRNFFESQVQSIAQKHGAASMFWEEVFDKDYTLLPSSVVDIWLSYDEVEAAVKAGHRIVSSFGLYLDQQVPFGDKHYFWADTWQNFYLADPAYNRTLSPAEASLILGGSISQWGEQADDANLESRMWPRAAGGAERLWSPAALRDIDAAEGRLEAWRCKVLQSRGVRAGPIRPSSVHGYCPQLRAAGA
jgi:hexosaminidase